MNLKTLDYVPNSHLVLKYQEEGPQEVQKTNLPSLKQLIDSFRVNKIAPLRGNFGGSCQNGQLAGDIVLALYVQETKALPESWNNEEYADNAYIFVKEFQPDLDYLYFGYENMFVVKEMSEQQRAAYNLGHQVWETLRVK